jgi:hypothetical protein
MNKKEKIKKDNVITIGRHSRLEPARVTVKTIDGGIITGCINFRFSIQAF